MLGVGSRSRRRRQLYTTSEARLDKVNITGTWGFSQHGPGFGQFLLVMTAT